MTAVSEIVLVLRNPGVCDQALSHVHTLISTVSQFSLVSSLYENYENYRSISFCVEGCLNDPHVFFFLLTLFCHHLKYGSIYWSKEL